MRSCNFLPLIRSRSLEYLHGHSAMGMDIMQIPLRKIALFVLISTQLAASNLASAQTDEQAQPLVIQKQGSFVVGGSVVTTPGT